MEQEPQQNTQRPTDWYEVNEEGEPTTGLKERLRAKSGIIIKVSAGVILAMLVLLGIFFLARLFLNGDTEVETQTKLYIEACQSEENVEKCIANVAPQLAQETGDVSYCEELEDDAFDSCVVLVALTSLDRDVCKMISDQQIEDDCNDAVLTSSLEDGYEYDLCDEYANSQHAEVCQEIWISQAILNGNCDSDVITDEMCSSGALIAEASAQQNPDICDSIPSNYLMERCYELVGPGDRDLDGVNADEEAYRGTSDEDTDSDDDGLSDYEEIFTHETDPTNPDTDGDTYLDGEEVDAGYDPLR